MKIFLIPVLLSLPLAMTAQKRVDLDRYYFNVQYRSLPSTPLDSSYHTYNVEVEGTRLMNRFLKDLAPEKSVILEGWKKLEDNAHITIKVKLDDLIPESMSVKERVQTTKNKAGQITGTNTFYHQELVYTFAAEASISDYKGAHIMDQQLANRNYKQVFSSPEFPLKSAAEAYFTLNALTITNNLYEASVNRAMRSLSDQLTNNFGYKVVTARDHVWVIGSRKHPEYNENRKAVLQMNDVLFSMNADNSIENFRGQLEPVIKYFESVKRNYASTSRHDRKIRYASYYNLAVIYYYLDDPQSMMKEANGLVLNDFDTKDGKGFEQSATNLRNLFQLSNTNTRHFSINTEDFKGPLTKTTVDVTNEQKRPRTNRGRRN